MSFAGKPLSHDKNGNHYHPELGRFLQNDPMGYHDSMNMYQAFNKNPVNFVDPMGKEINPRIVKYFSSHTKAWDYVKFLHSTYINCQGLTPYDAYKKLISKGLIAHSVGTESYLAFRPSLSIFDVTPAQFGKDVGTGFLNFCADQAYELGRGSHLRHRCNTTVFVTDIDKLVLDELDKSNERVTDTVCETYGGRKNSLGYFVGYVYGPTIISGGINASITLSSQTQFTAILEKRVFYTVQNSKDVVRLKEGGMPWPTADTRAAIGEGVYAWSSEQEALNYLNRIKVHAPDARIVKFTVAKSDLMNVKSLNIDTLKNPEEWMTKYSKLWGGNPEHGCLYIQRGTQIGKEHFFHKSIFKLLEFLK